MPAEADSGAEALAYAREPPADNLLLDLDMPDLDGLTVAREIFQEQLPIKILAFSTYTNKGYDRGIYDYGGAGYPPKSETPETLRSVLRHVARGESGFCNGEDAQILRDAGYPIEDRSL